MLSVRFQNSKRSEEHTSELQSLRHLVCRLLLEKKQKQRDAPTEPRPAHTRRAVQVQRPRSCELCRASAVKVISLDSVWVIHDNRFFFFIFRAPPETYPLPPQAPLPI